VCEVGEGVVTQRKRCVLGGEVWRGLALVSEGNVMDISELKVMRSAAGYYVGRSYWDIEIEYEGPYSRNSEYFDTEEQAQKRLDAMLRENG
jgi:hypothetical protein